MFNSETAAARINFSLRLFISPNFQLLARAQVAHEAVGLGSKSFSAVYGLADPYGLHYDEPTDRDN